MRPINVWSLVLWSSVISFAKPGLLTNRKDNSLIVGGWDWVAAPAGAGAWVASPPPQPMSEMIRINRESFI